MTFSKPFAGLFAYKGIIPSSAMNTINNAIPNALDKTGDSAAGGGGISGEVDILGGGSIQTNGAGIIQINTGGGLINNGVIKGTGIFQFLPTSAVQFQSANTTFTSGSQTTFLDNSNLFIGDNGIANS